MTEPKIVDTKPLIVELDTGDYWWCSCGQSQNHPYCDGSHKGTRLTPVKFTVEQKQKVALCQCKASGNSPFCDGSHSEL